jgi:hypothetical protein
MKLTAEVVGCYYGLLNLFFVLSVSSLFSSAHKDLSTPVDLCNGDICQVELSLEEEEDEDIEIL